jgi:tripartite-type tricarboxylate transporter receptor subunit TctC
VPTLNESGVPGYDATIWLGQLAPAGTPPEIVAKLGDEVAKVLNGAEARKAVAEAGVEVGVSTAAEFDKLLRVELERWEKVVKDTGATVD